MSGAPLTIADSQLMLPQPEWQLIAQAAKNSRNFAVQLEGEQLRQQRSWRLAHMCLCGLSVPSLINCVLRRCAV
jgi:hypothetical protein